MSTHDVPRIAHWRIARNPAGKEIELHPWTPSGATALKTATIHHSVGCVTCGEAVECDPPCDNPRWCSLESPCEGLRTAQEWARRHIGGTAPAVVTTPVGPEEGTPAQHHRKWTPGEDAWVVTHPDTPAKELAKDLRRGVAAVQERRRTLGIASPAAKPWSDHEDRLLRGCTTMRNAMAMLPGRTEAAIEKHARRIGHSFRRAAA